jgi:hypothetical protein
LNSLSPNMVDGDRSALQMDGVFRANGDRFVFAAVNAYNLAPFGDLGHSAGRYTWQLANPINRPLGRHKDGTQL